MLELLVAISLSMLIMLTVFDGYACASHLSNQLAALADLQERMQFLSFFLRQKIQSTGDVSCEVQNFHPDDSIVEIANSSEARIKFGIHAKPNTSVLKLKECIRAHNQWHYLPIVFYVKNSDEQKNGDSLYYKIGDLPSEELIPNMTEFEASRNGAGVHIQYVLSSSNFIFPFVKKYYFHGEWITPADYRFYQTGFLDAVMRKEA